jgi:hypothetical protein
MGVGRGIRAWVHILGASHVRGAACPATAHGKFTFAPSKKVAESLGMGGSLLLVRRTSWNGESVRVRDESADAIAVGMRQQLYSRRGLWEDGGAATIRVGIHVAAGAPEPCAALPRLSPENCGEE